MVEVDGERTYARYTPGAPPLASVSALRPRPRVRLMFEGRPISDYQPLVFDCFVEDGKLVVANEASVRFLDMAGNSLDGFEVFGVGAFRYATVSRLAPGETVSFAPGAFRFTIDSLKFA